MTMSESSVNLSTVAQSIEPSSSELDAQGVVEIVSVDIQKMLSFYVSLGFRTERRTGPFAVVSGFGVRLFLAENPDALTATRWANIRILVPDVDLIWDLLRSSAPVVTARQEIEHLSSADTSPKLLSA
jgi:catechol 2,3-dioxygenase-like lactoylglutathione lyase family enzyme